MIGKEILIINSDDIADSALFKKQYNNSDQFIFELY